MWLRVLQWKHEIVKYTSEGAVNVVIYHGPNRATRPEELAGTFTTYLGAVRLEILDRPDSPVPPPTTTTQGRTSCSRPSR